MTRKPPPSRVTVHVRDMPAPKGPEPVRHWRPITRADCRLGPRPCPFVGCRYHLFLDFTVMGSIKFNFGDSVDALDAMPDTCALDVAERGEHDMATLASRVNVTPARVQQEVAEAMQHVRRLARTDAIALNPEDAKEAP